MEQGSSFCVCRCARRTGHVLGIQLEYSTHRPVAVAQGARDLQTVSSPSKPGELESGSGHGADQERNVAPEPVARMLDDGNKAIRSPLRMASSRRTSSKKRLAAWYLGNRDVRYWSLADIGLCTANVCFRGESGHPHRGTC